VGPDVPCACRKGWHRRGSGLQEVEEKRAEANIAHRIVQLLLRELYDVHSWASILPSFRPTTLRQAVSTWTSCGGRLAPRRANEGYTAEPPALARLVCQAYHRRPGRTACRPPNASTRSLWMPAEEGLPSSIHEIPHNRQKQTFLSRFRQERSVENLKRDIPSFLTLWSLM